MPKEVKKQDAFEQYLKKQYTKFPLVIGQVSQSNYAFVIFSNFQAIKDYMTIRKNQ